MITNRIYQNLLLLYLGNLLPSWSG